MWLKQQIHSDKAKFFVARKDWTELLPLNGEAEESKHSGNTLPKLLLSYPAELEERLRSMTVPVSHALLPLWPSLASKLVLWRRKQRGRVPSAWPLSLPQVELRPERKEGNCSMRVGIDSSEYRLTCEAFWMWGQPWYCLWGLVLSAGEDRETGEVSCCRTLCVIRWQRI